MATPKEISRKNDVINFILKVKASRRKGGPVELWMDLNPDSRLIGIDETFSSQQELSDILKFVDTVLKEISDRTRRYNEVLQIDPKKKRTYFNEGYDQNFKPEFGKIDKIIHRHHSPGESAVSFTRVYNGDKKPT